MKTRRRQFRAAENALYVGLEYRSPENMPDSPRFHCLGVLQREYSGSQGGICAQVFGMCPSFVLRT